MGAGALLALAGLAVASVHVLAATRRWIQEMDVTERSGEPDNRGVSGRRPDGKGSQRGALVLALDVVLQPGQAVSGTVG